MVFGIFTEKTPNTPIKTPNQTQNSKNKHVVLYGYPDTYDFSHLREETPCLSKTYVS